MKRYFIKYFLYIVLIFAVFIIPDLSDNHHSYTKIQRYRSSNSPKAGIKMKAGRWEYFQNLLRDPATGKIPDGIREKELAFAKKLTETYKSLEKISAAEYQWKEAGPYDVGGRTRALAVDVTNPNTIIAGGASGGIWKSIDGGTTWQLKNISSEIFGITSLAQDPRQGHTNTWYYTTGEFLGSAQDLGYTAYFFGNGVYKSTDNGENWFVLPFTAPSNPTQWSSYFSFGSKIIVHPLTGNVFVACNGVGIFRSTDGGNNFTLVLGGVNEHAFNDIEVTTNGTLVSTISSGYQGWPTPKNNPGIYKSPDGTQWTSITPANFPTSSMRTVLGVTAANPNTVYSLTFTGNMVNDKDEVKFYKINLVNGSYEDRSANMPDFGNNFEDYIHTQNNYNMIIAVKPDNENFVIIGATSLFRSTNGFATKPTDSKTCWIGGYNMQSFFYPNLHPDVHSFSFDPTNPNKMWWGHDGGLSYTDDITSTSYTNFFNWQNKNNGYNVTQFYHISIPEGVNDYRIMGGTQDNGTPYFKFNGTTTSPFKDASSGDGSYSYFSNNFAYTSTQYGNVMRLHYAQNGDISIPFKDDPFSIIKPLGSENQLFINPFVVDPKNEDVMYYPSGNVLWRNTQLSQIPDNQNGTSFGWTKLTNHTTPTNYFITAINVSRDNPSHVLYYGASSYQGIPKLYKLTNADASTSNPQELSITGAVSGAYIHNIAINPDDGNEIIVVMSNYNITGLFHSTNGGTSFTPVEGNLEGATQNPGPSIRAALILPSNTGKTYFVGTSIGLFTTTQLNSQNTVWAHTAPDLIGNTIVNYVAGRKSDGRVIAATHGRGAFAGQISGSGTAIATLSSNSLNINARPDETGYTNFTLQNTGTVTLNYTFSASGGGNNSVLPAKRNFNLLADYKGQYIPKAATPIIQKEIRTKLYSISSEDVLYLDDGNALPDNFIGYGSYTGFGWANKFDLTGYGFDLSKIRVYLRSESSYFNNISYLVLDQNLNYLYYGDKDLELSQDGSWYEIVLDSTIRFTAGESFYLVMQANNLAYYPAGYDLNASVKNNSFYFPFGTSDLVNMNVVEGLNNGAYLLRAVGSKTSGQNTPPVASGTISKSEAAVGEQLTFDASGSYDPDGQITAYLWEYGDGQTSNQMVANHAYNLAGDYNVKLTVTDNLGATGSVTGTLKITGTTNQPPNAVAVISKSQAVINEIINFDGSQSNDPDGQVVSYLWNFGDGATASQSNTTHSYSNAGNYNYQLTVTDDKGLTDVTQGQINISDAPSRLAVNPVQGTLGPGETVTITVSYNAAGMPEGNYQGQVTLNSNGGNYVIPVAISVSQFVEVREENIPSVFLLNQNYPNPFNPLTTIKYSIPSSERVIVKLFDISGKEIRTLVDEEKNRGNYYIILDAANLASGVYLYNIKAGTFTDTKKLVILK